LFAFAVSFNRYVDSPKYLYSISIREND